MREGTRMTTTDDDFEQYPRAGQPQDDGTDLLIPDDGEADVDGQPHEGDE